MNSHLRLVLLLLLLALAHSSNSWGAATTIIRGPYLQQTATDAVVLRWRTSAATASTVRYGTSPGSLTTVTNHAAVVTDHVIALTGLVANTQFFYEVGSPTNWFPGTTNNYFITAPPVGTRKSTRIWVLGDSGYPGAEADAVRNAYATLGGSRPTDVWLMLGDNAYEDGTDAEHQAAVFDTYPTFLRNTTLWPTIGNHEVKVTDSSGQPPYYAIFTLPQNGEAGGIASGTEKYYSFDYANIHFICLDSMSSDRKSTGPMCSWLRADLAATSQEWLIAFFHHPPYSKGSHDSDDDVESVEMRQNFLPLLESYDVDLVLCGHSHSYERSFLIDGHYGDSSTLTQSMKKNGGSGRANGTGPYVKYETSPTRQGAVYSVAGSSSSAHGGSLNHPVMFSSLNELGSLVIDVTSNRLDFVFLKTDVTAGDWFTILKTPPPPTNPPALPNEVVAAAVATNQINLSWKDNSDDEDGFKVERSTNGVNFLPLSTVGANVTNGADMGLSPATAYFYRLRSFNVAGNSLYSEVAQATTFEMFDVTPPAAVTNLFISRVLSNSVTLLWISTGDDGYFGTASRYDVRLSTDLITEANWEVATPVSGSPVPSAAGNVQALTIGGLSPRTTYYFALKTADETNNLSPLSNVPGATTLAPDAPAMPTDPIAIAVATNEIALSWFDASDSEDGFKIERSTNGLDFGPPVVVGPGVTAAADSGLAPSTTYFYRVRAFNSAGDSPFSDIVQATTLVFIPPDITPPAAVTNLFVANMTSNSITLSWSAPGDDDRSGTATSYEVRYSTAPIVEANFFAATPVAVIPLPAPAGVLQVLTVNGLVPNRAYYFALKTSDEIPNISPLSNVPSALTRSNTPVTITTPDAMRLKWFASLTGGASYDPADPAVQELLAEVTASANAQWSKLVKTSGRTFLWSNLTSTANSSEITTAYNRILAMAMAWATWGGPLYSNATLGTDIVGALDWMYTNRYNENDSEYDNWWDWEIGAPMALNDICVLMYDRLTAAQLANYMNAVNEFTPTPDLTGANRVWKTRVVAIRGALVKDASKLVAARDAFTAVFPYVTSSDGFYADGSFIQHVRHPYIGGYGASLLDSLARVGTWLQYSTWAITAAARTNVANWTLDSYAPVLYRGALMEMIRGREIARVATDHDRGRYVMESLLRVTDFLPTNEAARVKALLKHYRQVDTTTDWSTFGGLAQLMKFRELLADPAIPPAAEPVFHKQFPSMTCAVHTRPGFGFAIRMSSSRVFNYESLNNENLHGWFTGDGMTYLYNQDLTQFDEGFWPTVNPYRLPGTTVDTTTRANASGQEYLSPATWVGGASLEGTWGAVGFDLDAYNSTLVAKKSWFLFDDEIICLGANINCTGANRVETTVENRRLAAPGDAAFSLNGATMPTNPGWSNSTAASYCWLDGTGGYYFPGNPIVKALRDRRTGLWSDINQRYGSGGATNTFLTLWLDHGIRPVNATYNYVLLPNKSAAETAAYAAAPQITIVQNTAQSQAVRENSLGILAANFWSAGTVDFVTSGSPASIIARENGDRILVGVSDPTQGNSSSITVTLGRSASALVSADPGITITRLSPTIQFVCSVSGRRGQTLRAVFAKGPPAITLLTPTNNAVFSSPASVPFAATVASNGWAMSKVEFLAGGTPVGESVTPPYTFSWNPAGGGAFTLAARAVYAGGSASSTQPVTVNYRLPPAPPANLAAIATATNKIGLSWTETATDEDSFLVECTTNGTDFVQIAVRGPNVTNLTDTGLMPDTTYSYRVRAHNPVGYSPYTDLATATTLPPAPDTNAPAAVSNLTVVLLFSNSVTLRWTAPGNDDLMGTAARYDLRISLDPILEANWDTATSIDGVPPPGAAGAEQLFTLNDLLPGTTYFFALKTADETNNVSPLSNVPGVLTPQPELPSMPSALIANAVATNEIDLSWTDHSDTEEGFQIERSLDGIDFVLVFVVGANATSAVDLDVLPSTTYWYRVTATNAAGVSPAGNLAAATTPDPIPPDSTAPAAVTNLSITAVTSNSVTLAWTASGDDSDTGTASAYDLRCSTSPITLANFAAATPIPSVPWPQTAGSRETNTISDLLRGTIYYFALQTIDDSNNVSPLSNIPYTTTRGLPAPWLSADIGAVGLAGSALHTNGIFTVRGAGADITSKADAFHYLYQPASGNCDIIARITTISNTSSSAKAGVMIRESLTNNSRFAATLLQPDKKMLWLYRAAVGDSASSSSASGSFTPPTAWVRVTRTNSIFNSYSSLDGITWKLIKSRTMTMNTDVFIGIAVTSRSTSRLNGSTFDRLIAVP